MPYILSLDQGTTSSRSILVDEEGKIIAVEQQEFKQIFPRSGWVEHDPMEIWLTQLSTMRKVVDKAGIRMSEITAIGITNQRETTVVWDRHTGLPIHNAIVWQDRRTADICDALKGAGHTELIRRKTGLVIDSYFSGTKIQWILDNVSNARDLANTGRLAFGTVDSWLIYNLTAGGVHLTDVTNASRTMLFNILDLQWDSELLGLLNIPESMLPEVKSSGQYYATTAKGLLDVEIPIMGVAGDQQAALFGQQCTSRGMAKNTYGTGCFMLMNTGSDPVFSDSGLLTTIAWGIDDNVEYALEGSVFIAGAAIQWLRDGIGLINSAADTQLMAEKLRDNGGVYFVPAMAGLGTPHWDMDARGMLIGITRGTTKDHIARATLESIAFQTSEVLNTMASDEHMNLNQLRVDGGAAVNDFLMQFQADILGVPVARPTITESTAIGAAYMAGIASDIWDLNTVAEMWEVDRVFEPELPDSERLNLLSKWNDAVERSKGWASTS